MKFHLSLLLTLAAGFVLNSNQVLANDIYQPRENAHGVGQFAEVMPGVLYRGGQIAAGTSPSEMTQLNANQLGQLCEQNIGEAIYLYSKNYGGPVSVSCSQGQIRYESMPWQKSADKIMHKIFESITVTHKPVFVHCWWGIHATGAISAMALMQFCDASPDQAVDYWKVGIAPKIQYQTVIDPILAFRPNPDLALSAEQKAQFCPQLR